LQRPRSSKDKLLGGLKYVVDIIENGRANGRPLNMWVVRKTEERLKRVQYSTSGQ
jgi:hypothetical protein